MNYQNNRAGCPCTGENRGGSCPYGRTPWSSREGCSCGRRPWNTRSACAADRSARSTCPYAANTTWRNRGEGCSCSAARSSACPCQGTSRVGSCSCGEVHSAARSCEGTSRVGSCSCGEAREVDCDSDCNHGAKNTGLLDGKSLAMVYSPYQKFDSLYDPRQGLCNGTIFGELNKPFYGDGRGC